jgi:hypothetical protein
VDHVLFRSDCLFDPEGGPMYIRETIRVIDALDVTDATREQIYEHNIRRFDAAARRARKAPAPAPRWAWCSLRYRSHPADSPRPEGGTDARSINQANRSIRNTRWTNVTH